MTEEAVSCVMNDLHIYMVLNLLEVVCEIPN
jgi:hypothetical protein